jgi:hypothetical protein
MLDIYRELISRQYEASLCMLGVCFDRCPEARWNEPIANLEFCQAAFHVLFFTDVYLGANLESLRQQPFHQRHAQVFADYEELGDAAQQAQYEKPFINAYFQHCREKATQVVAAESAETLQQVANFDWIKFSRAELHAYNIRHIQHHTAQLSLRLRLDIDVDIPWISSGWRDV